MRPGALSTVFTQPCQCGLGEFQHLKGLFASDRGKVVQEFVQGNPRFEIVQECRDRDARAAEDGGAAEHLGVYRDGQLLKFAIFDYQAHSGIVAVTLVSDTVPGGTAVPAVLAIHDGERRPLSIDACADDLHPTRQCGFAHPISGHGGLSNYQPLEAGELGEGFQATVIHACAAQFQLAHRIKRVHEAGNVPVRQLRIVGRRIAPVAPRVPPTGASPAGSGGPPRCSDGALLQH